MECDQSKAHRHAVPRTTDNRTPERAALLYADLAGPMELEGAGQSQYVMMIVVKHSRFRVSKHEVFSQNGGCTSELYRGICHPGTAQYPRRLHPPRMRV